jgi:1-deoxy-D-xylulose-5-phosphate reductoisomerase
MRFPILYALSWPERLASPLPSLDLAQAGQLTFEAPDPERFPALELARHALRLGGEMPAVLNAANETAVDAFLQGHLPFAGITTTTGDILHVWAARNRPLENLDQALETDVEARRLAGAHIASRFGS